MHRAQVFNKVSYQQLYDGTLQALHNLGGSARNQEIHDKVVDILGLSDEEIALPHGPRQNSPTDIKYRLGWVRTWLKRYGLLENSGRGVWSLTSAGLRTTEVDSKEVDRVVSEMIRQEKLERRDRNSGDSDDEAEETAHSTGSEGDESWRAELDSVLAEMTPSGFERLCQRILRESGFTQVEVTQATHDGGIDGRGILQVNEFLSFRVVFQCKRYSGSVGPDVVQKLRGAMPGSADRGLIVTTGIFTQGAVREATHEHKSPIELVDGEDLLDRLKELELGVKTEMVPKVTINPDFFANI